MITQVDQLARKHRMPVLAGIATVLVLGDSPGLHDGREIRLAVRLQARRRG